jgi:hypothetical protein
MFIAKKTPSKSRNNLNIVMACACLSSLSIIFQLRCGMSFSGGGNSLKYTSPFPKNQTHIFSSARH